jgi:hypothetical protein
MKGKLLLSVALGTLLASPALAFVYLPPQPRVVVPQVRVPTPTVRMPTVRTPTIHYNTRIPQVHTHANTGGGHVNTYRQTNQHYNGGSPGGSYHHHEQFEHHEGGHEFAHHETDHREAHNQERHEFYDRQHPGIVHVGEHTFHGPTITHTDGHMTTHLPPGVHANPDRKIGPWGLAHDHHPFIFRHAGHLYHRWYFPWTFAWIAPGVVWWGWYDTIADIPPDADDYSDDTPDMTTDPEAVELSESPTKQIIMAALPDCQLDSDECTVSDVGAITATPSTPSAPQTAAAPPAPAATATPPVVVVVPTPTPAPGAPTPTPPPDAAILGAD